MFISPKTKNETKCTTFGSLYSCGWNNGQLGSPNLKKEFQAEPLQVSLPQGKKIKLIAHGGSHVLLVTQDNCVFGMGRNQSGQLGIGSFTDSMDTWTELKDDLLFDSEKNRRSIVSVDCGDRHSFLLFSDGKGCSFGQNFQGQLSLGHTTNRNSPQELTLLRYETLVKVSCGSRHTCILTDKGKIWTAGNGTFGQLGNGTNVDKKFPVEIKQIGWKAIDVRSQGYSNIALSTEFEVYIWGGVKYEKSVEEGEFPNNIPRKIFQNLLGRMTISVRTAASHFMALTSDGSVWIAGKNLAMSGYTKVMHAILNSIYHPDEQKNMLEVERELMEEINLSENYFQDLKKTSGVELFKIQFFPPEVQGKIIQIECADNVNYALTSDGKVFSWGQSKYFELGLGENVKEALKPTLINSLKDEFITRIIPGCFSCSFLTGSPSNFHSDLEYVDLGAKLPKSVQRRNEM